MTYMRSGRIRTTAKKLMEEAIVSLLTGGVNIRLIRSTQDCR